MEKRNVSITGKKKRCYVMKSKRETLVILLVLFNYSFNIFLDEK